MKGGLFAVPPPGRLPMRGFDARELSKTVRALRDHDRKVNSYFWHWYGCDYCPCDEPNITSSRH
jgi:hypothetical protein